jgi:hypothetical protein
LLAEVHTCPILGAPTATGATLCGEVNPNGLATKGFFELGDSPALGSRTATALEGSGTALMPMSSSLTELEPNETYHYKAAGEGTVDGHKLLSTGEEATFRTATLPPQITTQPSASYVQAQSAILTAALNPEHLTTRYAFEYGPCPSLAGCATVSKSAVQESSQYSPIGSVQEIHDLTPQTTYSYRFTVDSEAEEAGKTIGGKATSGEGTFTTGALPAVQATTAPPSAITPTSALISGSVNPDGQPATYGFEPGVYAGAETRYGIVFSGPAAAETTPIAEALSLTGLQPGTTYAYRITIHSGYGTAEGAPMTFTTEGLPSALTAPTPLAMLAIPTTAFPTASVTTPTTKALTDRQKLTNALGVCKKEKQPKHAGCEKTARKRYGAKTTAKKNKK